MPLRGPEDEQDMWEGENMDVSATHNTTHHGRAGLHAALQHELMYISRHAKGTTCVG